MTAAALPAPVITSSDEVTDQTFAFDEFMRMDFEEVAMSEEIEAIL